MNTEKSQIENKINKCIFCLKKFDNQNQKIYVKQIPFHEICLKKIEINEQNPNKHSCICPRCGNHFIWVDHYQIYCFNCEIPYLDSKFEDYINYKIPENNRCPFYYKKKYE